MAYRDLQPNQLFTTRGKLQAAHDNYARAETSAAKMCQQLTLGGSGG